MSAHSFSNRLFSILVLVTLVVMAVLSIKQAADVAMVAKAASALSSNPNTGPAQCLAQELRQSVTTGYVKKIKMWIAYTEDGPTGVDGGLIYLLSLPPCS